MNNEPDKTADAILRILGHLDPPEDMYSASGSRLYDQITANDLTELPEILAAARKTTGPILELAAGSGRITRALLALGRPLTAVDSSVEMLAMLKEKAEDRTFNPRTVPVELVEADMSGFDVGGEFGCVVLGASSITLLDPSGRRELFRRVGDSLAPDGRFLLTVLNADGTAGSEHHDGGSTVSPLGEDSFLITVESRDIANGARNVTMIHVGFNEGGTYRSSAYSSRIAFVSNGLIEEEILAEGLTIVERRPVRIATRTPGLNDIELWVCSK
ncbi:class I SAM-dependent methyltransferase [Paenarthrobacter nitroguajacolicus]|uniref:daptide-type RiPP biosynthesis methyltransferase n=1 Tax=Paenarthrobacter nitroguajacolicus TaxID=211146 RepID=UPI0015B9F289|nr:daptide-type RiPP biosynthesis methyltransferase [Paenarthrobacter nitroguajacolicus]NWL11224.1 class I SAM-dependent methyltransferase [Paenarthrobacter nitroguajacolicus]